MAEARPTYYLAGQPHEVSDDIPSELGEAIVHETVNEYWRVWHWYQNGFLTQQQWRTKSSELLLGLTLLATQMGPYLTASRRLLKGLGIFVGNITGYVIWTDVD